MGKHLGCQGAAQRDMQAGATCSFALPRLETPAKCREPANSLVVFLQEQGYQASPPSQSTAPAIGFWLL